TRADDHDLVRVAHDLPASNRADDMISRPIPPEAEVARGVRLAASELSVTRAAEGSDLRWRCDPGGVAIAPRRGFPLPSGSIDRLIVDAPAEALDDADAGTFFRSCHRVLAADGRAEIAVG